MIVDDADSHEDPLREALRQAARMDEENCVAERLGQASLPAAARKRVQATATRLVEAVRRRRDAGRARRLPAGIRAVDARRAWC